MYNVRCDVFGISRGVLTMRGRGLALALLALAVTTGGAQAADLVTTGTQHVVIPSGTTYDNIWMYDQSSVTMGDGVTILDTVRLLRDNTFTMTGGSVGWVRADGTLDSVAHISGGSIAHIFGGFAYSTIRMSNGSVEDMGTYHRSTGYLSGGTVNGELTVNDLTTFHLSGGDLAGGIMRVNWDAEIYLYADDFGPDYQAGQVLTLADLSTPFGDSELGTHFDLTFPDLSQTSFDFIADATGDDPWTGSLHLIPEPGTVGVLLCGGLVLMRRRS